MPDPQTPYETRPLRAPGQGLRATPPFDKLHALYQDAPWTARQGGRHVGFSHRRGGPLLAGRFRGP